MNCRLRPYPEKVSEDNCRELARELKIPLAAASLLCRRGIATPSRARRYLSPKLKELPSPFLFKGMRQGVHLVIRAMEENRPVVVYGDYDVDGISATALLVDFLSLLHLEVHWHIPNRLTQGYGLSSETLADLSSRFNSPALLITVDNGVSAVEEVATAKSLGYQVLVTDHHEPSELLPEADGLINPKQNGCDFPFKELSGAGVAFYLTIALRSTLMNMGFWNGNKAPNLKNALDLVALGTVADVMPLVDVNRILVRAGLEILTERKRPGIWALCEHIGLGEGVLTTEDISFRIAPRINASGRMGSPETAARLLMCRDVKTALEFARALDQKNRERRQAEAEILPHAVAQCERQADEEVAALVVYDKAWHPGVIGIVASRLTERFSRPVIALTDDPMAPGHIKGSGRTVEGVNLYRAVESCSALLEKFGGHPKAIGLTLMMEKLENFTQAFNKSVEEQSGQAGHMSGEFVVDCHIKKDDAETVNQEFISLLRQFEPFGEHNPEPVFLLKGVRLSQVSLIKGEHLKFSVQLNGRSYRGIGFGMGKRKPVALRNRINLIFKFKHSVYRGRRRVELMALNITPTD